MRPGRIQDLFRHMEWADAVVWAEVLRRPETASDGRLRELLYHAHTVQWVYLQLWEGETIDVPALETFEKAAAVREWGREAHRRLSAFLADLDAEALGRELALPWASLLVERYGRAEPVTMEETLLQVAAHSTYHRGQVNARLRELGGEPPLTDYVAWIWMGRPGPVSPRAGPP